MRSGIGTAGGTNNAQPGVVTTATADVIMPTTPTYEVKTGDTLAGIALIAYKRASPRLLDEICRANNMRNANVLSLGQKLVLPEYRPQQVASMGTIN
jgi:LysM repeat protein